MLTLNEAFSALSVRRRYEVWFLRMGLADGSGAWWFRYLMMNPGRGGCTGDFSRLARHNSGQPGFRRRDRPQSFIQGFPVESVGRKSPRSCRPFVSESETLVLSARTPARER